jgi:hypothetical protein
MYVCMCLIDSGKRGRNFLSILRWRVEFCGLPWGDCAFYTHVDIVLERWILFLIVLMVSKRKGLYV